MGGEAAVRGVVTGLWGGAVSGRPGRGGAQLPSTKSPPPQTRLIHGCAVCHHARRTLQQQQAAANQRQAGGGGGTLHSQQRQVLPPLRL